MSLFTNESVKEFVKERKEELKNRIKELKSDGKDVTLVVIQVGDNPASTSYIKGKKKDAEELGITLIHQKLSEETDEELLISYISELNKNFYVDGIIVQLPLPDHINVKNIQLAIDPKKDVDGFHPMSLYKPCTPAGVMSFIEHTGYDLCGKRVFVIGRSDCVGKPLAEILMEKDAVVTVFHSKTPSNMFTEELKKADFVFTAVNKPCQFSITAPNVIDIGLEKWHDGKLHGNLKDGSVADCMNKAMEKDDGPHIVVSGTGGVGLLTRLQLMENVIMAAKINKSNVSADIKKDKVKTTITLQCVVPQNEISHLIDNFSCGYPEFSSYMECEYECLKKDEVNITWSGDLPNNTNVDELIRLTHHAEGIYFDTSAEFVHVEVCINGKWYGKL